MSRLTKILLTVMIIGLVFGGVGISDAVKIWNADIKNAADITVGGIKKGELYEGDIPFAYDIIAEQVTSTTYGPVPVSKTRTPYYLVQNENCFYVINVTASAKKSELDTLADLSWDQIDGTTTEDPAPVSVSTTAEELPDEVKDVLKDYCGKLGLTDEEYEELVEDSCCLRTVNYSSMKYIPIAGFGVAVLCALILIIRKVTAPRIVNL